MSVLSLANLPFLNYEALLYVFGGLYLPFIRFVLRCYFTFLVVRTFLFLISFWGITLCFWWSVPLFLLYFSFVSLLLSLYYTIRFYLSIYYFNYFCISVIYFVWFLFSEFYMQLSDTTCSLMIFFKLSFLFAFKANYQDTLEIRHIEKSIIIILYFQI